MVALISITQKPDALARLFFTSYERAVIAIATKENVECGMGDNDRVGSHKEAGSQRLKKDESDLQKLVSTVLHVMTDPFCLENADDEDSCSLLNIATGVVMPDKKADRLITSAEPGEKHMKNFVEKRLNTNEVWEPFPISKLKHLPLFQKKKENRNWP